MKKRNVFEMVILCAFKLKKFIHIAFFKYLSSIKRESEETRAFFLIKQELYYIP